MADFSLIISLAPALAVDAAAVAAGAAMHSGPLDGRAKFRLVFHFSLFQAAMPFAGWWAGDLAGAFVSDWAGVAGGGVLALLAVRMLLEREGGEGGGGDPTRGKALVALSFATSIDAFAAGAALGVLGLPLVRSCVLIGLVTAVMCSAAIAAGHRSGRFLGRWMRPAGAVLLLITAVRMAAS